MKLRHELLLWLVMFVISFLGLNALEDPQAPTLSIRRCSDHHDDYNSSASFPVALAAGLTKIHFNYRDSTYVRRGFDCWIDSNYILREELKLGYPAEMEVIRNELDQILTQRARIEAMKSRHNEYLGMTIMHKPSTEPGLDWHWYPSKSTDKNFDAWLHSEAQITAKTYFRDRGFDLEKYIEIDYKTIGDEESAHISDCYDKLIRHAGADGDEEIARLLLTAFQEMCIEFPMEQIGEIYKAGFWPPVTVLQHQGGDCDSKAVALFALWQRTKPQMMLFVDTVSEKEKERLNVPLDLRPKFNEHALLGIDGIPEGDQKSELEGLRRFVYCEVSAPRLPGYPFFVFSGTWKRRLCLTDNCAGPDKLDQKHSSIHLFTF